MRLQFCLLAVAMALAPHALAKGPSTALSDANIRTLLIQQSINAYPGNCPCPYNAARNGSSCGGLEKVPVEHPSGKLAIVAPLLGHANKADCQ